jgi:hypothetical protein
MMPEPRNCTRALRAADCGLSFGRQPLLGFVNTLRHPCDDDRNLVHASSGQDRERSRSPSTTIMSILHKENRMWHSSKLILFLRIVDRRFLQAAEMEMPSTPWFAATQDIECK